MLPDAVSRLEHIAIECSELATETASAFDNTGRLIDELILGCQAKKVSLHGKYNYGILIQGMSKIEFEDVLIDLQVTTQSRINHEKHLELFEKEATKAEKEIDAAVDKYQKAIDDKPSFLEVKFNLLCGFNIFNIRSFWPQAQWMLQQTLQTRSFPK